MFTACFDAPHLAIAERAEENFLVEGVDRLHI
jgi:hypothetical protein